VDDTTSDTEQFFDDAAREASGTVLRQAFVAAQLGMPSEDFETAVETLWIIFEALLIDHVASSESESRDSSEQFVSLDDRWRRLVTAAVIHTFVLSGDFVMPEALLVAVEERATRLAAGQMWHTRRPPAQGALVLGVHAALLHLERTGTSGKYPDKDDADALQEIIALATLGAVLARGAGTNRVANVDSGDDRPEEPEQSGRWARSPQSESPACNWLPCTAMDGPVTSVAASSSGASRLESPTQIGWLPSGGADRVIRSLHAPATRRHSNDGSVD
jgi:hypothetical protein